MKQYKIGDSVKIKAHEHKFGIKLVETVAAVPPDHNCKFYTVQIVGLAQVSTDDFIALCDFDPHYYISFKIDPWHCTAYDVQNKFVGYRGMFITTKHIWVPQIKPPSKQIRSSNPGGASCKLCKKFVQYANVNRDDGTFVCRRCVQARAWSLSCKPLKEN